MTCEEKLAKAEEINNKTGQALVRIMLECAVMSDRLDALEKEGKDVSTTRELIAKILPIIGG